MDQTTGLSIALLATLGSGFALYKRANETAAGLVVTASVALASIKSGSKKGSRAQKGIRRSYSAPDLRGAFDPPPLRSVPLFRANPTWQPAPIPDCPPPPPLPQTSWFSTVKLSALPRRESSFLGDLGESLYRAVFAPASQPAPYPPTMVDGVVDLRGGVGLPFALDLEDSFGSSHPSLEMGAVKGAGGAGWIILTDELTRAQEIRSIQPKALVIAGPYLNLSLPSGALKRIDLRLLRDLAWKKELQNFRLFSPELRDGGELHLIFKTSERQFADGWIGGMRGKEANLFDPPREEVEGDELHFIYRRKERGVGR